MNSASLEKSLRISFIGSAGIPNRYGGFESFLEHCAPVIAAKGHKVQVTCDARLYDDHTPNFRGVERIFLTVPANGGWSLVHDLLAFIKTYRKASHIVVLGVSGGLWFPFFRLLCDLAGKRLLVNVDGVEWRRTKFGRGKRWLLKLLDILAQQFAHTVIYDNEGLHPFLLEGTRHKAQCIAYSGDHVSRSPHISSMPGTALTICRIEPENNLEMLIKGALASSLDKYTIVGNWNHSPYARHLRQRYLGEKRLELLDPIYDPQELSVLRESCAIYIHGHSVGGTNPSLVEMLFYDCALLCFDVAFNRHTAGDLARYFDSAESLAIFINSGNESIKRLDNSRRDFFTAVSISERYLAAMMV